MRETILPVCTISTDKRCRSEISRLGKYYLTRRVILLNLVSEFTAEAVSLLLPSARARHAISGRVAEISTDRLSIAVSGGAKVRPRRGDDVTKSARVTRLRDNFWRRGGESGGNGGKIEPTVPGISRRCTTSSACNTVFTGFFSALLLAGGIVP